MTTETIGKACPGCSNRVAFGACPVGHVAHPADIVPPPPGQLQLQENDRWFETEMHDIGMDRYDHRITA